MAHKTLAFVLRFDSVFATTQPPSVEPSYACLAYKAGSPPQANRRGNHV